MSIKRMKKHYKVLSSPWNFLDFQKEDFVSFSMSTDMNCESFKWGFLAQRCSFVRIYITCDKRKTFPLGSVCKRVENIMNFEPLTKKEDRIKKRNK